MLLHTFIGGQTGTYMTLYGSAGELMCFVAGAVEPSSESR